MTGTYSWVSLASLIVACLSLGVTVAIFMLGKRLSFRQQRERTRELKSATWDVLGPVRTNGLNNRIIVMNIARYKRGYDGSNELTWRGYSFTGPELIELGHGGVEVIESSVASYVDTDGRRTLHETNRRAASVFQCGHIPWAWIDHIEPQGDEFDGSAIFYVRCRAAGRRPYHHVTFRETNPVAFGPNNRDYYPQIPSLGTRRPRWRHDWWQFAQDLRTNRAILKQSGSEWSR